ncbi:MAG: YccF domain-containing protein [Thermodesulfovibrionales bacterium]|jgi:uncharacterized membrane protein YccF (DUF307 family)
MRVIGNFLWFILGGVVMGLGWWVAGLLAYLSIVGIPWGKACFVIGQFTFFPCGIQHLKLAAIAPIGKTSVPKKTAEAARKANAESSLSQRHTGSHGQAVG